MSNSDTFFAPFIIVVYFCQRDFQIDKAKQSFFYRSLFAMKILLVDKHILFRDGLASMLSKEPDFPVVGEAGTTKDALEKIMEHDPD